VLIACAAESAAAWRPVGPAGGGLQSLAFDPSTPSTLYSGAISGGVWKSTDGGERWSALSGVPKQETVFAIAVDPKRPQNVLAGTFGAGIWRSADGGATWKRTFDADPYDQATIRALVFDPATSSMVYAGTDSDGHPNGVLRSTDGGATWKAAIEGLPKDPRVYALAIDARTPTTLFAASGEGVFRTSDGAGTWQPTGAQLAGETVRSIAVGADGTVVAGVLSEGLWWSADGGAEWTRAKADVDLSGDPIYAVLADPRQPGVYWAGAPNHVLCSTDGGRSFATLKKGISWINFLSLGLDPAAGGTLFAGTNRDGLVAIGDGGKTWTIRSGDLHALAATSLATPAPGAIYLGSTQAGVHASTDGGTTWRLSSEGLTDRAVLAIVADPRDPKTLLAGTESGIFRTTDGAATWQHVLQNRVIAPEIQEIVFAPSSAQRVYARDADTVYRSDDGGATWKELPEPERGSSLRGIFALAVSPASPDVVLANAHRELFRSTDGGASWTVVAGIPETSRIQSIVADAQSGALWAGTTEGIHRSADGGATWSVAGRGAEEADVQALLVDPAAAGTIYAATWTKGVLRSSDGGKTWAAHGGKPPHPDAVALALEAGPSRSLLVAFDGGGLWRLDL
jgi:photosystem II stability/assembly factor-like uncharacterized protein